MKQSRNGYKLSKFPQKILADLFVYSDVIFEQLILGLTHILTQNRKFHCGNNGMDKEIPMQTQAGAPPPGCVQKPVRTSNDKELRKGRDGDPYAE